MDPWLYYPLALLLLAGGALCLLANLFNLPGNWLLVVLVAAFAYFVPSDGSRA